jgi:sulfur relay (sulfurtransferase) DsrF/TusC family protein
MAATPLIATPKTQGGTFYAFSSASRDLSRTLNDSNIQFVFSKFVALNLPDISKLDFNTFSQYQNYIQFDTMDGSINNGLSGDVNIDLAESLQNYALNLESLLLNDQDYDTSIKKSVAERVFFKWLKETGAIRFKEATENVEYPSTLLDSRFLEEDEKTTGSERYNRVVQYIGDIDIVNNVDKAGETYTEIWLHVPTEAGNTPYVLFDTIEDENYKSDLVISGSDEFLYGRGTSTIHPEGLRINAFYDYDDSVDYTDANANVFNQTATSEFTNSYFTESGTFEDASNTDIKKYPSDYGKSGTGTAYRRSNLDGISIDFEASSYYQIVNNPSISSIQEFNNSDKSNSFNFNAVLIYYDIFDANDPTDKATNLFGILVLDNVTPTANGGYIERLPKLKPNRVTRQNGNSWGMVLNLKIDASVANSEVDSIINEYNTFSMGLFADTMAQLQESVSLFTQIRSSVNAYESRIFNLENSIFNVDDIQTLNQRMDQLESSLSNAQLAFSQSTTLLDLIASNSDAIQQLVNGNTTLQLQYNTDVIEAGSGIVLDKSVPNKIKVKNKTQEYNIVPIFNNIGIGITSTNELDLNSNNIVINAELLEYTNLYNVYTKNTAINDIKIKIDDSGVKFKKGQTIRIVFKNTLDINFNNILIYTDFDNNFGQGSLNKLISQIDDSELLSNRPIIELICLNDNTYEFTYDILR